MLPSRSSSSGRAEEEEAAPPAAPSTSTLCCAERGTKGAAAAEISDVVDVAVEIDPGTNGAAFTAAAVSEAAGCVSAALPLLLNPLPPPGTKGLAPAAAARDRDDREGWIDAGELLPSLPSA